MTKLPIQRAFARAAVAFAATAAMSLLSGMASAAPARSDKTDLAPVLRRTVLAFPVEVNATGVPNSDEVSGVLEDVTASRLSASGLYTVTEFSRSLPAVARLRTEQQLSDADVTAPFDNAKAVKIAKAIEYDVAFIGSVEDYKYDSATKQAEMTVSGTLIDVTTGKVIKLVTLSATSAQGGTATEEERALAAARAAGEKMMSQLLPAGPSVVAPTTTTPGKATPAKPAKKRARMDWLWAVVAVGLGLGIGLTTGGNGGNGSSGGDTPPAPPH